MKLNLSILVDPVFALKIVSSYDSRYDKERHFFDDKRGAIAIFDSCEDGWRKFFYRDQDPRLFARHMLDTLQSQLRKRPIRKSAYNTPNRSFTEYLLTHST